MVISVAAYRNTTVCVLPDSINISVFTENMANSHFLYGVL
jgi:hypothetical protein